MGISSNFVAFATTCGIVENYVEKWKVKMRCGKLCGKLSNRQN